MTAEKKTLYLIDGANYVFRAYYAIRALSTSRGFPTNALYGFAQMLLKLVREEKPDYMAVCLDTVEPTFRDELYEDYKANRKEPPDDLVQQFPYVVPLIKALGIPVIEKPGFEADDIIGTLAARHASEGLDVVLVSGDKDLMQLVGPNVTILDEMKEIRAGRAEVEARFGVGPEGVVEVLALSGDQSDNVPGIPGIGPKTAMKLIAEYGSIDEVIAHASEIKGSAGKKIVEHAELARLSKRLVTIDTSVPVNVELKDLVLRGPDKDKARELFKELEFSKLLDELAPEKSLSFEKYRLITEEKDLKSVINSIINKKILSIDLETTSLDQMQARIVGFALAWEPGMAAYVPVGHLTSGSLKAAGSSGELFDMPGQGQLPRRVVDDLLRPILADPEIKKIGQNLNYDLTILRREGFVVEGVDFDTMLASYLLDPAGSHGLDSMASTYLGHRTIHYEDVTGKGKAQKNFAEVELDVARDYACEDADAALRLAALFRDRIEQEGLAELFYKMEMPLLSVLVDMQLAGIKVDREQLAALGSEFGSELATLEKQIHAIAGMEFNINSPKQLREVLFDRLKLKSSQRTKTGPSTSQEVLEELAAHHELPALILRWRSLGKLKSTYIDALTKIMDPATSRIHTTFNQATAATGRLSSSDPNLQNIPIRSEEGRRIREAFVADEGNLLISADYSQIELRVLAHMSREPALLEAFGRNEDVHALTASGIFGVSIDKVSREQRAIGKTVNFATIYGQTAYGLSRQLGISPAEASEYIDNYFLKYPRVAAYREEVLDRARREGKVTTLFGRRRFFPDIESANGQLRQLVERMAFNTVFQGTAADIIKRAMIVVHEGLPDVSSGARLLLQVHDELVVEAPEGDVEKVGSFVKKEMEAAASLDVPLLVDVGKARNWAEAH